MQYQFLACDVVMSLYRNTWQPEPEDTGWRKNKPTKCTN